MIREAKLFSEKSSQEDKILIDGSTKATKSGGNQPVANPLLEVVKFPSGLDLHSPVIEFS